MGYGHSEATDYQLADGVWSLWGNRLSVSWWGMVTLRQQIKCGNMSFSIWNFTKLAIVIIALLLLVVVVVAVYIVVLVVAELY